MHVVFVFPYRNGGGVPQLFARCAIDLVKYSDTKVSVIDYSNGSLANLIKDSDVRHMIYPEDGKVLTPDNSVIVFQLMTPWSLYKNLEFGQNCKILFWACHPFNVIPVLPLFRRVIYNNVLIAKIVYTSLLRPFYLAVYQFLEVLEKSCAIVFMDRENYENITDYLNYNFKAPKIVPLGVNCDRVPVKEYDNNPDGPLRFLWIGRIVDFKFFALRKFIEDLNKYCLDNGTTASFKIIGDGDYLDKLIRLSQLHVAVKFEFLASINIEQLPEHVEEVHCAVAMGTSAIDCAALKVPTIVIDFHYKEFPSDYRYRFLHEQTGAVLGCSLARKSPSGRDLPLLMDDLMNRRQQVGEKCHGYVLRVHNQVTTVAELRLAVSKTKLTPDQIYDIVGKIRWIYDLFFWLRRKVSK